VDSFGITSCLQAASLTTVEKIVNFSDVKRNTQWQRSQAHPFWLYYRTAKLLLVFNHMPERQFYLTDNKTSTVLWILARRTQAVYSTWRRPSCPYSRHSADYLSDTAPRRCDLPANSAGADQSTSQQQKHTPIINNNNNNNSHDNVYGAFIMTKVIARVDTVHSMNADWASGAWWLLQTECLVREPSDQASRLGRAQGRISQQLAW